jgi:hypothetical protein
MHKFRFLNFQLQLDFRVDPQRNDEKNDNAQNIRKNSNFYINAFVFLSERFGAFVPELNKAKIQDAIDEKHSQANVIIINRVQNLQNFIIFQFVIIILSLDFEILAFFHQINQLRIAAASIDALQEVVLRLFGQVVNAGRARENNVVRLRFAGDQNRRRNLLEKLNHVVRLENTRLRVERPRLRRLVVRVEVVVFDRTDFVPEVLDVVVVRRQQNQLEIVVKVRAQLERRKMRKFFVLEIQIAK